MTEDETKPYAFNGQRYATELESVEAAYQHALGMLGKMLSSQHPEIGAQVLERFVELTSMCNRLASGLNIMLSTLPEGQREPIAGEQA